MPSRILIADDHDLFRHHIKRGFEYHADWVCIEAENGQQAVVKATELKPDIIILDLAMPVMDGLTAAREIVKILPAVPIVIHTTHFSEQIKCEAKKIGVREVLPKADIASLVGVVEALLGEGPRAPEPKPALRVAAAAPVSASRPAPVPTGRCEKRTARVVPVELSRLDESLLKERAFTENLSPHGVRVVTEREWRPGTIVLIVSSQAALKSRAQIVYCQPLGIGRFAVGVKLLV